MRTNREKQFPWRNNPYQGTRPPLKQHAALIRRSCQTQTQEPAPGMRAVGSPHWLHTVSTQFLTWYFAHRRRGSEAMDAVSKNGLTALDALRRLYQGTPFLPTPDNP